MKDECCVWRPDHTWQVVKDFSKWKQIYEQTENIVSTVRGLERN